MSRKVNTEFEALMALASKRCRDESELQAIRKAFDLASNAHSNVLTHTGEPYILRSVDVARIVLEKVGLGYKSICAALLMDVPGNLYYTLDDIRLGFGDKIAQLVEGLQNINKILASNNASVSLGKDEESERQAENFKRVLLTLGDDVRVVLIKLADRLQDCRHLDTLPRAKRDRILSETMFIFIPLAHRLGLYSIKSEMENYWLKYEQPQAYTDIMSRIDKDVLARTRDVDEFIAPINAALTEKGYAFEIKKRIKTPCSIWYKMKNKGVPYEQIYDIYAVRIIFDPASPQTEREQAYAIYSIITRMYTDKPSRTRDWIKQPKTNGYEALHCTLMSKAGIWVEVQIRSRRMDDIAEKGIAAHWSYKKDGYLSEAGSDVDNWLVKIQEILGSGDINSLEMLDIIQDDILPNEIVVFTPMGEQLSIPKGSTALDFAYRIHTNIGNSAIAAKVNMKLAPLSRKLKAGDQVEIITARNASPKTSWLSFLHTGSARRKVLEYIKANDPEALQLAENMISRKPEEVSIRVNLLGINHPGLAEEIVNALKKIDGIEDVSISELQ